MAPKHQKGNIKVHKGKLKKILGVSKKTGKISNASLEHAAKYGVPNHHGAEQAAEHVLLARAYKPGHEHMGTLKNMGPSYVTAKERKASRQYMEQALLARKAARKAKRKEARKLAVGYDDPNAEAIANTPIRMKQ